MAKNLKKPISVRLNDEEMKLLDRAAKRFGDNKTKAVVEGLRRILGENELSRDTLLAEIARRLK